MEKQDYSLEKVNKLIEKGDAEKLKGYVGKYFYKIDGINTCIAYWKPSLGIFLLKGYMDVKQSLILKDHVINKNVQIERKDETVTKKIKVFSLYDYFFGNANTKLYNVTTDPHKPPVFKHKEQLFVNFSPLPVINLNDQRKYDDFPKDVKKKVMKIVNHIYLVYANKKEDMHKYLLQWFAHALQAKKMTTILYLKAGQGCGKSILFEWIRESILGQLAHKTSNTECIVGTHNAELLGKVLLVLEEMPADGKNSWISVSKKIKDLTTSNQMMIRDMFKIAVPYPNYMSIAVISNEDAVKLENDDRRFVCLDISEEKTGDKAYFKNFAFRLLGAAQEGRACKKA